MHYIYFDYNYIDNYHINIILNIGIDTYKALIDLSIFNESRYHQIIEFIKNLKLYFNSINFIVKYPYIIFNNWDTFIKYNLTNYNNNLQFSIYNNDMWIYEINFISNVKKNSDTIQIDELSNLLLKTNI